MNITVCAHTSGLATSVCRVSWTKFSPYSGGAAGCSHWASGGMIQDTAGSRPAATSSWKSSGQDGVSALLVSSNPVTESGSVKALK